MPIQSFWFSQNSVILSHAQGTLTDADIGAWDAALLQLLEQSRLDRVHVILQNAMTGSPPKLEALTHMGYPKHPRLGWVVVVNTHDPLQRFLLHTAAQAAHSRLRFVESFDEGLVFLQDIDDALPDLLAIEPPSFV